MIDEQYGPQLAACETIHSEKYRGPNESFREAMGRVANALADGHEHYQEFRQILLEQRFLPAGRVQAAMGSPRGVTPYNCFVMGTINDTLTGPDGIMQRAGEAAHTMRMGGGVGYDFSTLRPQGDMIRTLGSRSSGPIEFMGIYDATCKAIRSAGNRRGAQMGVIRVDHPDIERFIRAKQNDSRLNEFNISVAMTDKFMEAMMKGEKYVLRFDGRDYGELDATAVWDEIMRSNWDWAEPGALFIDRINYFNNLYYCEDIAATNPCGEQPLPPWGACLLGSFNLVKYLVMQPDVTFAFNYDKFGKDVECVVRAMDNVIDRATYPLKEQREEALSKRRMGLGVTGAANAIEALGYDYGTPKFCNTLSYILRALRDTAYMTSAQLSKQKGSFGLFKKKEYLDGKFVETLPDDVKAAIKKHGIRNSHLTSIAPTGTISLCADNVSSGIEPIPAFEVDRTVRKEGGPVIVRLEDYGLRVFGHRGKTANEVTPEQHISVLTMAQKYVDSAVSKTCNLPEEITWDDFKNVYTKAYLNGAKGVTVYKRGCKREGIMKEVQQTSGAEGASCYIDTTTGRKECE